MIEYLKELSARLDQAGAAQHKGGGQIIMVDPPADVVTLFKAFAEELDRFDPRDFEPQARAKFVEYRANIRHHASQSGLKAPEAAKNARKILPLLDQFAGEGSRSATEEFLFVQDVQIRPIVQRDYRELTLRSFPDGAWKSTVILSGGILEAILYDQLTKDAATIALTTASPKAPKKGPKGAKVSKVINSNAYEDQWHLVDLIAVAADLNIISKSNEDSIDEVLRQYRNFVHPRVEVEKGVSITEGHALAAIGGLKVIIDKLK